MPFKSWYYICKLGAPVLMGILCLTFFSKSGPWAGIGQLVIITLLSLAAIGFIMGILMVAGRLQMRCPFCAQPGPAGGNKRDGLWMKCPSCGLIRGRGLQITKEPLPKEVEPADADD